MKISRVLSGFFFLVILNFLLLFFLFPLSSPLFSLVRALAVGRYL